MNDAGGRARVLHVGKYYPPVEGGIEAHLHALATGLTGRYDVTALVFNTDRKTNDEVVDGVRVVRVGSYGRVLSTEASPSFLRWFGRLSDCDLIHLHTPNPVGELACLSAPKSARLVITYHSDVIRQRLLGRLNRLVLHRLMRRADRIIAFTRRYVETSPVVRHYAEKCSFIPHGVDLAEYEVSTRVAEMASRLRARHGPRIVLFLGRLVYYKGVDVLLRSFVDVPDAKLLVIGDGPMRSSLEAQASSLDLGRRVIFLGRLSHDDKVAALHACDVFVLPATHRSEAFGVVQVEAMACSRPVISTNIDSGVPFVNQDGLTGLVVAPGDAAGLTKAMVRLLDDGALRDRMGEAGRKRTESLFSRKVMLRDTLALYGDLIGTRAATGVGPEPTRASP